MINLSGLNNPCLGQFAMISKMFEQLTFDWINLGPVVQSIVSLTSSLVVKMLTVLVSTISNSQVFFAEKKNMKSYSHFFSATISAYMPYLIIKVLMIR